MARQLKIALDLAEMIKAENTGGKERIPTTDSHMRVWCSHFGVLEEVIRKILENLREAHYIFIINLVSPDPNLFLSGIDAYVFSESSLLNEVKKFSEDRLEKIYEATYYKRKSSFQITRELFPKAKELNNTPIGKILNETVMIEEYARIIQSTAFEYTDQWKKAKLLEIYKDEQDDAYFHQKEKEVSQRAVDQLRKTDEPIIKQDPNWVKLTQNFTPDFLLRVHFRKYEFDVVKKLVQSGKITNEKDLKFIRDTLQSMERNVDQDAILTRYMTEMVDLRRYVQAKLNILRTKK